MVSCCLVLGQGRAFAHDGAQSTAALEPDTTGSVGFLGRPALTEATLAGQRGGAAVFNDQQLNATLGSNVAANLGTGTNTLTEGAFGGTSGFPTVIQNTGNNVIIQNSTILNLQLR